MKYSGSGDTTAAVQPVDVQVPPPAQPGSTSGCEAADFAGFTAGNVALIQRGTCDFAVKAANAEAAGASAVIIFNEGQPGRTGDPQRHARRADCDDPGDRHELRRRRGARRAGPPVRHGPRRDLDAVGDAAARRTCSPTRDGGDAVADRGRRRAPRLGDRRARGSTTTAPASRATSRSRVQMAKLDIRPRRQLRFAFWGAEESGLLGVPALRRHARRRARLDLREPQLRHDRLAELRPLRLRRRRLLHAADGPARLGADRGAVQRLLRGAGPRRPSRPPSTAARTTGRSSRPASPPAGCSPAPRAIKTPEQAAVYGGTAGVAYDPNYHQPGDTVSNLSSRALGEMSDGVAHATMTLARSRTGLFEDASRRPLRKAVRTKTFNGPLAQR